VSLTILNRGVALAGGALHFDDRALTAARYVLEAAQIRFDLDVTDRMAVDRKIYPAPPQIQVRWLSGRKRRFAKALYLKRVPRVRIPPSPGLSEPFAAGSNKAFWASARAATHGSHCLSRRDRHSWAGRPTNSVRLNKTTWYISKLSSPIEIL
jgi:hypothetical protein